MCSTRAPARTAELTIGGMICAALAFSSAFVVTNGLRIRRFLPTATTSLGD